MTTVRLPSYHQSAGFTLLEILVVMTIASGLVLMGVAMLNGVTQAAQNRHNGQRDWITELYLRQQMNELDPKLTSTFSLGRMESETFRFVSRRSAQFGEYGPPALVEWHFAPNQHELRYRETIFPPWWDRDASRDITEDLLELTGQYDHWDGVLFADLSAARFQYWSPEQKTWTDSIPDRSQTSRLVRLELEQRGGRRTLIFETNGALSSFLSSGSSSGAP